MSAFEQGYTVASNPNPDSPCDPLVLFAGESRTKPGHAVGPKVLRYYLLHCVLDGAGTFVRDGQSYAIQAGDCFLIEPDALVSYTADSERPWHYRWVAFQGESARALLAAAGFSAQKPVAYRASPAAERIPELLLQIRRAFADRVPLAALEATGYLFALLAACGASVVPAVAASADQYGPYAKADVVKEALHYLSMQYAEEITMETLAASLGYNRAYLSRQFKKHTGVAPVTFLLRHRIDHARRLLRERDDLTIEQIAFSVGFRDPLYFTKQFKRLHGHSPSAYRLLLSERGD